MHTPKITAQHHMKPHMNEKCDMTVSCDLHTEWFSPRKGIIVYYDILGRNCAYTRSQSIETFEVKEMHMIPVIKIVENELTYIPGDVT